MVSKSGHELLTWHACIDTMHLTAFGCHVMFFSMVFSPVCMRPFGVIKRKDNAWTISGGFRSKIIEVRGFPSPHYRMAVPIAFLLEPGPGIPGKIGCRWCVGHRFNGFISSGNIRFKTLETMWFSGFFIVIACVKYPFLGRRSYLHKELQWARSPSPDSLHSIPVSFGRSFNDLLRIEASFFHCWIAGKCCPYMTDLFVTKHAHSPCWYSL